MQNISLNKKLVISANKTAEIQEKRFFIKMLEKKAEMFIKIVNSRNRCAVWQGEL